MKTFVQNDQVIAYRHKPGLLRTIVFANSLGSDQSIWDEVINLLPKGYGVLTLDLRGHGLSGLSKSQFTIDDLADDIIALIEHLGLQNSIFCGVSIGGMIGQSVASRRPDLLSGAILSNTCFQIGTAEKWNERITAVESGGMSQMATNIVSIWFGDKYKAAYPDKLLMHEVMLGRTSAEGYAMACKAIRDADLSEHAKNIQIPVLCIGGDQDLSVPADRVKTLAGLIPNGKCEILEGIGHIPSLEYPDQMALLIETFEQSLPASANLGMKIRRAVLGDEHVDRAEASKQLIDEAFQSLITKGAWATVWSSPYLSARERSLLTLALLAANGNFVEIPMHVRATARTGATWRDIAEAFQHVAIYCGVPKANHALKLAKAALAEMNGD